MSKRDSGTFDRNDMLATNAAAFSKILQSLKPHQAGKFALMRDEKLVDVFDSARGAHLFAEANYPEGRYSVHRVRAAPVNLGAFSKILTTKD